MLTAQVDISQYYTTLNMPCTEVWSCMSFGPNFDSPNLESLGCLTTAEFPFAPADDVVGVACWYGTCTPTSAAIVDLNCPGHRLPEYEEISHVPWSRDTFQNTRMVITIRHIVRCVDDHNKDS